MRSRKRFACVCATTATRCFLAIVLLPLATGRFASAQVEHVIHIFANAPDGWEPNAGLVADQAGNLYGTTVVGGSFQCCGSVFELSPPTSRGGAWTEWVIYSFTQANDGGQYPMGTLLIDHQGNLYGTTLANQIKDGFGGGSIVFELSPPATPGGTWSKADLYKFPTSQKIGADARGNLIMDGLGDLFATTSQGEDNAPGEIFELRPPAITGSRWRRVTLHNFGAAGDGANVNNNLIMRHGSIYGTTYMGGAGGKGTVFELKQVSGVWRERVIYSFIGSEAAFPRAGLTFDSAGNLYGTTLGGGTAKCQCGVVFKLSPPVASGDAWTETTLYSFTDGKDGGYPLASLIVDKAGNLYGTASGGGLRNTLTNNNGTVFELSPPTATGVAWTLTTLHEFGGPAYGDGRTPLGELFALKGKLYGTTFVGGDTLAGGGGIVFEISPP